MKKLLLLTLVLSAFTLGASAQSASGVATATAVIVSPISLTHVRDLSFGNIVADADGGTVAVNPAGARTLTGLTSPSLPGTVTSAEFTVAGLDAATYAITLPASHIITNGTQNMTVDNFQSTPSGSGTLTGGTEALTIGATLNVNANQQAGTYTNGAGFTVTVNYN